MEAFKTVFVQYMPEIISGLIMVMSYFLIFLFRHGVKKTKQGMTAMFKENNEVTDKQVKAAKAEYKKGVEHCLDLENRLVRLEQTMQALLDAVTGDTDMTEEVTENVDRRDIVESEIAGATGGDANKTNSGDERPSQDK